MSFPNWSAALDADDSLTPSLREVYRRTVGDFLRFCRTRRGGATVALAREFVDLANLERAPGPGGLQEWKDALNWFFRKGQEAGVASLKGVPSLGREDLGRTAWERELIARIRNQHLAWRTEQSYRGWVWRFVRYLGDRPLAEAGADEIRAFLSRLAVEERLTAATQKQALNALVFHFREVIGRDPGDFSDFVRARRRVRAPVVLSREECDRLFEAMEGTPRRMAELMFGRGIRLLELLRLRVKDVDWERGMLVVRSGKGDKDRVTVLPERLQPRLRAHRERLRRLHAEDRLKELPGVWMPEG